MDSELGLAKKLVEEVGLFSYKTFKSYDLAGMQADSKPYKIIKNKVAHYAIADPTYKYLGELIDRHEENGGGEVNLYSSFIAGVRVSRVKKGLEFDDNSFINPFFYSIKFLESILSPNISPATEGANPNIQDVGFPYNQFCNNTLLKIEYMINAEESFKLIDMPEDIKNVAVESFLSLLVALEMDLKFMAELDGIGLFTLDKRVELSANGTNLKSKWFIDLLAGWSGSNNQFFKDLAKYFDKQPWETIKGNYNRWCRNGNISEKQWPGIIEFLQQYGRSELTVRCSFAFSQVCNLFGDFIDENGITYDKEKVNYLIDKWRSSISGEYSRE